MPTPKEEGLLKGAIRRVFSQSELRKEALIASIVTHSDSKHPRVKKWAVCAACNTPFPAYQAEVDHIDPVVAIGKRTHDYTWDEIVARLWCDPANLQVLDKTCHKAKTAIEQKARREVYKLEKLTK